MFRLEDFRAGCCGLPFSCVDELPECCGRCHYLIYQETACAMAYYTCGYNLPDRLTQVPPACQENPA